ncbi:MAG: acyltransferase [Sedimentisphaerales bacterium]
MSNLAEGQAGLGTDGRREALGDRAVKAQSYALPEVGSAALARHARIASVERLRILAIFGIVWFHSENASGRSIGYAGLPIFLMLFYALSVRKSKPEDFFVFAKKKARRLLKPWIFWVVVYTVCMVAKQMMEGASVSKVFSNFIILAGPRIHLWYMPFAFLSGLLVNSLQRTTQRVSPRVLVLGGALAGGFLLFCCSTATTFITMMAVKWNTPSPQWIFALPAIPLGFSIGRVYSSFGGQVRRQRLLYLCIVVAVEVVCVTMLCFHYVQLIIPYGIAIVFVCVAFLGKARCSETLLKLSSVTFGIYLIHPLIGSIFDFSGLCTAYPFVTITTIFIVSALIIMVLQKTPLKQFV